MYGCPARIVDALAQFCGAQYRKRRLANFLAGCLIFGGPLGHATCSEPIPATNFTQQIQPLLETYCTGCHGSDAPEADLRLEMTADDLDFTAQHELWSHVQEKLRTGEMPPEDELQPTDQERHTMLEWVDLAVAQVDCRQLSQPGRVTIHRLNRTEYNNTVRDLVGIDFQPAADFPADDVGNGFDNIADVLSLPPLLMEKYLAAAEQIVDRAMSAPELQASLVVPVATEGVDEAARQTLTRFASRAFRRPVDEAELAALWTLYEGERDAGVDYPQSVALPLIGILTSPNFLFRIELDSPTEDPEAVRALNPYELASRLSYFLWSSMPDERLFEMAAGGHLTEPQVLAAEVERMLKDDKSQALLTNFVAQWLQLRSLNQIQPDPERFPTFDGELRAAMLQETQRFAQAIVSENLSVLEFLDADFTYLNERLAKHYGVDGIEGDEFRRVSLSDARRGGILTQASILTLTSNPTRTSPVKRGKWILENILGTPPPPPPPGVRALQEEGETELLGSLRERMAQHRTDPSCSVCHKKMDALGFGFENFDAIGAWRDHDGGFQIDPSGTLPGNQVFEGPAELRKILMNERRDQFLRCLCEKMLTYALGRELKAFDRCAIDAITKQLKEDDYRFHSLVKGIVASEPFCKRGIRGVTQ